MLPLHQESSVAFPHRDLASDLLVEERLGVRRFVRLVVTPPPIADDVDDDVVVKLLPVVEGHADRPQHRLRIVAVDVENGRFDALRHVGAEIGGARFFGAGGVADLIVHDDVHGPPGGISGKLAHVESLGHHALAGEGGVTVDEHGKDTIVPSTLDRDLHGAGDALDHRIDGLQVTRVAREGHRELAALRILVLALRAEVVLDVTRALDRVRVDQTLELREDLLVGLVQRVHENVESTAVGHSDHDVADLRRRRPIEQFIERGNQTFGSLEGESFVSEVAGVQESLEGLGGVELVQDLLLLAGAEALEVALSLHAVLQPPLLLRLGEVHVLGADFPAVSLLQGVQDLAQARLVFSAEPAGDELAIEIPDRQPVVLERELRGALRNKLQRVQVGHPRAAGAVGVDEFEDPRLFFDGLECPVCEHRRIGVARRVVGQIGALRAREELVVEALVCLEQPVEICEQLTRLRTLNDAVVVGAGHRHDLGDAEFGHDLGRGEGVAGGPSDRAGGEDQALARHEARHGRKRPDRAGIGEGDRRVGEVLRLELALPSAIDQRGVGLEEGGKVEGPGILEIGDDERARAVLAFEIDRHPEVDLVFVDATGRAAAQLEAGVEPGHPLQHLHQGEGDDVREGGLRHAHHDEVPIQEGPIFLQQFHREGAHGGGGRDLEARLHVLDDLAGDPAQGFGPPRRRFRGRARVRGGGGIPRPFGRRGRFARRGQRQPSGGRAGTGQFDEKRSPVLAHRAGVARPKQEQIFDEGGVRPEITSEVRHADRSLSPVGPS